MFITSNEKIAICSTDIREINNKEMRQMHELKQRIATILDSHEDNTMEKKYATDEDLKLMWCILHTFTREYANTQTSAFDDAMKERNATVEKPETLIKGGPGYPVDSPIAGESKNY